MTGRYLIDLLKPGRIGTMELRNRIVHAPMSLGLGAGDGTCGERFIAYYAERAKGGAGLINIGTVSVGYPEGSVDAKQIAASDDKYLPSLRALADAIHAHGAKVVLQLNHNGLQAGGDRAAGRPLATPSLPEPKRGDLGDYFLADELAALVAGNPVAGEIRYALLDAAGIARVVNMFAAAALRAKRAGIDAVEIHGGHGYLLASFLSPVTNRRADAYGGSVENRARFLVEVLRAVRAAVGPDFPVWCKIDSTEFALDGGISIEDAKLTARLAEAAGADAISVSAYSDVSKAITHSGSHTPQQPELLVPNARAIKAVVTIPVITAGRIEAVEADRHIAAGAFDFVAFGRKLLADPLDPAANAALDRQVSWRAMLRTTCIPTQLEGGHAVNAQPQRARAIINCRLLPGSPLESAKAALVAAVNNPAVKVTDATPGSGSGRTERAPPPPLTAQVMGPIEQVAAKVFPGVPVTPMQETFGTDAGRQMLQMAMTMALFRGDDAGNIHGLNEHISVQSVMEGRDFMYRLIKVYAEQR